MALRFDASDLSPGAMLSRRWKSFPLRTETVTFEHDGAPITARLNEPVAIALLAAGRHTLARSPKYHRPRGPACLRGACDGCLVRVDDTPNAMACRVSAQSGMKILSQNAFPTAGIDVLGLTDWFFPHGLDHHHLLASSPHAINTVMQSFARKLSGLGALPETSSPVREARTIDTDVLIIGAGPSGCAAATALSTAGFNVTLVDTEAHHGGSRLDDPDDPLDLTPLPSRVDFHPCSTAVATYSDGTLVADTDGVILVHSRARLFATGLQPFIPAVPNNDLPGVMTSRALARTFCYGVAPARRILVVGHDRYAHGLARNVPRSITLTHRTDVSLSSLEGSRRVHRATLSSGEAFRTDLVAIAGHHATAYELIGQAGVSITWNASHRCYEPVTDADGATSVASVYVTGTVRLGDTDVMARVHDGERVAARIVNDLTEITP